MLSALLALLQRSFHPTRTSLMWVLLLAGLLLAGSNVYQTINARRAATLDRAAVRAELLDSLQRAGELRGRSVRRFTDTALTRRAARQQAAADTLRPQDERLEKRYRANRLFLPAL